jgi:hypothetical protein
MDSFHGDLAALKDALLPLDLDGEWEEKPNGIWRLRCRNKAGLNWSSTTGKIWCDGPDPARTRAGKNPRFCQSMQETWHQSQGKMIR